MRLVEKILSISGIMLLGMSLGVGLSAACERRSAKRVKRKAEPREAKK